VQTDATLSGVLLLRHGRRSYCAHGWPGLRHAFAGCAITPALWCEPTSGLTPLPNPCPTSAPIGGEADVLSGVGSAARLRLAARNARQTRRVRSGAVLSRAFVAPMRGL
jgi:hypothetical protein